MRQQTVTMNERGFSMSRAIPDTLGEIVNVSVDPERKQIIIDNSKGPHMALITYPADTPYILCRPLARWIRKELGNLDYQRMPVTWEGNRAIVQAKELA